LKLKANKGRFVAPAVIVSLEREMERGITKSEHGSDEIKDEIDW
jgi:hypothetical protein